MPGQQSRKFKFQAAVMYEVYSNTATVAELVNICDNKTTSFTNSTHTQQHTFPKLISAHLKTCCTNGIPTMLDTMFRLACTNRAENCVDTKNGFHKLISSTETHNEDVATTAVYTVQSPCL